jgi:hypothetical protein
VNAMHCGPTGRTRLIESGNCMAGFRTGERVDLIACPGFPGTVTGFAHGKVQVQFDDFRDQPAKVFRPESLQVVERGVKG